jgi:5'-phosphate synthase pdxT subunit
VAEVHVGVLAIQGDFARHLEALARAGAKAREVRTARELDELTHLVLPGGESTTMLKFLADEGLDEALVAYHKRGGALFATCAGLILIAREVTHPPQRSLALLDATVERNAYGRQVASFIAQLTLPAIAPAPVEAVFIRAPIIRRVGKGVEVLASHAGTPVLVREGKVLAATFHPELTPDPAIHRAFLAIS